MNTKKKWEHKLPSNTFYFFGIQKNATASFEQLDCTKKNINVWLDNGKENGITEVKLNKVKYG